MIDTDAGDVRFCGRNLLVGVFGDGVSNGNGKGRESALGS